MPVHPEVNPRSEPGAEPFVDRGARAGLVGTDLTRYVDARLDGLSHSEAMREVDQLRGTSEPGEE